MEGINIKILIIGDEAAAPYHPMSRIIRGIYMCLEKEYELTVSTSYKKISSSRLREYDMVISYIDCYQKLNGYDEILSDYIFQGGKFLALHNGIISKSGSSLERALGGNFVTHPPYCELTYYLWGAKFAAFGEEAYMVLQSDDKNEIFLEFEYEGKRYPGGWFRQSGKGKVAYLAPGHDEKTGDRAEFQKLLRLTVYELLK